MGNWGCPYLEHQRWLKLVWSQDCSGKTRCNDIRRTSLLEEGLYTNNIVVLDFGLLISILQDKLNLSCIHSPMVTELMRGIRSQIEGLITGLPSREMAAMCLGLAHRWVSSWNSSVSSHVCPTPVCLAMLCCLMCLRVRDMVSYSWSQDTFVSEILFCKGRMFQFASTL